MTEPPLPEPGPDPDIPGPAPPSMKLPYIPPDKSDEVVAEEPVYTDVPPEQRGKKKSKS